jgi:hypothetical protein
VYGTVVERIANDFPIVVGMRQRTAEFTDQYFVTELLDALAIRVAAGDQ